jgi:hypothetical protein
MRLRCNISKSNNNVNYTHGYTGAGYDLNNWGGQVVTLPAHTIDYYRDFYLGCIRDIKKKTRFLVSRTRLRQT